MAGNDSSIMQMGTNITESDINNSKTEAERATRRFIEQNSILEEYEDTEMILGEEFTRYIPHETFSKKKVKNEFQPNMILETRKGI